MNIRWRLCVLAVQLIVLFTITHFVAGNIYVTETWFFAGLLAYVWRKKESGEMICANVEMVRLGFSEFWTKYGKGRYPELFEDAESKQ